MKPVHPPVRRCVLPALMLLIILSAVLAFPAGAAGLIAGGTQDAPAPYASDAFFVKYLPAADGDARLPGIDTDAPAEILLDFSGLVPGLLLVRVQDGYSVEDAVAYYADLSGVEYAEPDYLVYPCEVPNDLEYTANQWGLHNPPSQGGISAESAWDISTGNDSIVVAVVDSGLDIGHPDIAAHVWNNTDEIPDNGVDDDGNGFIDDIHGWNFYHNNADLADYTKHGTHCAGVIGAVTNNSEGIAGTAWNVTIMPLKVFPHAGSVSNAYAIAAVWYAVNNSADIISMSLGGGTYASAFKEAIDAAAEKGILCVCSAGNGDSDNDVTPQYPASYDCPNILAVAASDSGNNRTYFSNWGKKSVDIAAPGVGIYSTIPDISTNYRFVGNFSLQDIQVLGQPWEVGKYKAYIKGANSSLIYSTTPVTRSSMDKLLSAEWYFLYNISGKPAGAQFLVSNKSFSEYRGLTDFQENQTGLYIVDTLRNGKATDDQQYRDYGFTVDDMKIGDGPYYLGVYYTSDQPDNLLYLLAWGFTCDYVFQGHTYGNMDGTSMATPMVAGAAALIKSVNSSLTPAEIRQIVIDTADIVGNLSDVSVSHGRLNLSAALMMARSYCGPAYVEVDTWDQLVANATGWTDTTRMRTIAVTGDVKNTAAGRNYQGIPVTGNITVTTLEDTDAEIDANLKGRLFNVDGGSLTFVGNGTSALTLANGLMSGTNNAGAVMVKTGNLTISSGVNITGCSANCGGAVFVDTGSLTMDGGNITGCSANHGGGVFVNFGGDHFTMTGGGITGCTVTGDGGGVEIWASPGRSATFNVSGSAAVTGNARKDDGVMSDSNVCLKNSSSLHLDAPFTGTIGIVEPSGRAGMKFGTYAAGCEEYAKNFLSDTRGFRSNATGGDLVWEYINTTVEPKNNIAEFHNTNSTTLKATDAVSMIVLENVSNVDDANPVIFNATSAIARTLPVTSGYRKIEDVAVFEIAAEPSADTAYINVTITFADAITAAANKGKVSFWHYADGAWETPKLDCTIIATDGAKVTYRVVTDAFSPFGISLEGKKSVPSSSYSGGNGGATIILTETPTLAPTAEPTQAPTVAPSAKPTTLPTQKSPAPFVGLAAGLGAAALLIRMRR